MAELIAMWAIEEMRRTNPRIGTEIAAYKAGYLPEERRRLENDLKAGRLKGIISTNALELGIDIGSLDAAIIAGYPGTAISTWQQAGRSGRGQDESIAVLVAFEDALDQFFMRNPQSFFGRPHEIAIVDNSNPYINAGHVMCATAEIPVNPNRDGELLGPDTEDILNALATDGLVRETPRGWVYTGKERPTEIVSLDGIGSDVFTIVCGEKSMGTMDHSQAFREAHEGAVLVHQGKLIL